MRIQKIFFESPSKNVSPLKSRQKNVRIVKIQKERKRDMEEKNATAKEPVQLVVQPVVSTPSVVQVPISVVEKPVEEPKTEEPQTEEPEVEPETEEVQYIRIKEQKLVKENDATPEEA
jgi:hypothetical protein